MKAILPALVFTLVQLISLGDLVEIPETNMDTATIIIYNGYPCETHQVTTDDGYILTMHRIPHGKNNQKSNSSLVVFLQHGLLDSSFTWVCNLPSQSLGFILADLGYDVWLGNSRGNVYSKAHDFRSTLSNAFWDFTWDDMAEYDLPAMINYVLSVTKAVKLSYVGHSQGNTMAFAKLSENGPLNSKISSLVALAPVPYLGHTLAGSRHVSMLAGGLNVANQLFNHGEFLPNSNFISTLKSLACGRSMTDTACSNVLFLMNGHDTTNINKSRLAIYLAHIPAGTSSKNILHYAQSYEADKFQMFDHGIFGNLWHYRRIRPPLYELNTYNIPVAIFNGGKDKSATPIDVNRTVSELGSAVVFHSFVPTYSHVDFLWAINASDVVYKDLVTFIRTYQ